MTLIIFARILIAFMKKQPSRGSDSAISNVGTGMEMAEWVEVCFDIYFDTKEFLFYGSNQFLNFLFYG